MNSINCFILKYIFPEYLSVYSRVVENKQSLSSAFLFLLNIALRKYFEA